MADEALGLLVAQSRIIDAINALFVATDERDWPAVRQCFTSDVLFDMTSLSGGEPSHLTPSQIAEAWESGLRSLDAIHHQAGNYRVDIAGGTATAFCYATAWHYRAAATKGQSRAFVGSYDFELREENGAWRISMFRFNLKFIDGNVDLV